MFKRNKSEAQLTTEYRRPTILRAHAKAAIQVSVTSGSKKVWSAGRDGRVTVWDRKSFRVLSSWEASPHAEIQAMAVVKDHVWAATSDGLVTVWDSKSYKKLKQIIVKTEYPITCFQKAGNFVWGGSFNKMQIWMLSGTPGPTLPCGSSCMLYVKLSNVNSVWTSGGVSSEDLARAADVLVWDSVRYSIIAELKGHKDRVLCLCNTKQHVWSGGRDKKIFVWSKANLKFIAILEGHAAAVCGMAQVNNLVWSASQDGFIRCWTDTSSPQKTRSLHVSDLSVNSMVHIPVADQVWVASSDGSVVVLHNVSSGSSDDSMNVQFFEKDGNRYVGDVLEANTSDAGRTDQLDHVFTKHGQGELHFSNGDIYVGSFKNDMMHGHGVYISRDGQRYMGNWKQDKREGRGVMVSPDGSTWEGDWEDDVRCGHGRLTLPSGDMIEGEWKDKQILKAQYTQTKSALPAQKYPLSLQQCFAQLRIDKLQAEEDYDMHANKWRSFIEAQRYSEDFSRTDTHAFESCVAGHDIDKAIEYIKAVCKDRRHPVGQCVHRFSDIVQAAYQGVTNMDKVSARSQLHHATDDIRTFHMSLTKMISTKIPKQLELSMEQVNKAILQQTFPVIFATVFKLYRQCNLEQDMRYEAKLRALSDISIEDVGAKLAEIPAGTFTKEWRGSDLSDPTPRRGSVSSNASSAGIGDDSKTSLAEFLASDPADMEPEVAAGPTPQEYFRLYPRPYEAAIAKLRQIQSEKDVFAKTDCILQFTAAIVEYWQMGGLKLETMGADDLMPAIMYSIVKAQVPHMHSELKFLDSFVTQDVFVEFSEYLLSRKRMSDMEAALNFLSSVDMNVRDEKRVLVPVSTLVDRVVDTLTVVVSRYTEENGSPPRTLWIAEVFLRISNRGPHEFSDYVLEDSLRPFALEFFEIAAPIFEHVGLSLIKGEGDSESTDAAVENEENDEQEEETREPGDIEVSVRFRIPYPLHVYSKIADSVASAVDVGVI